MRAGHGFRFALLGALVASSLPLASAEIAVAAPSAAFSTCREIWDVAPRGFVKSYSWAMKAVREGFAKPYQIDTGALYILKPGDWKRVSKPALYTKGFSQPSALLCGRKVANPSKPTPSPSTPAVPAPPTPSSVSAIPFSASGDKIYVSFKIPFGTLPRPVFDIYVNERLAATHSGAGQADVADLSFTAVIDGLAPSTTYSVSVIARSPSGSSPPSAAVTVTTSGPSAPSKPTHTIEYTAGCGSGQCTVIFTNASGGDDRVSPTPGAAWTIEVPKTKSQLYSIIVFDDTFSSSTSCQIKLDGRVVTSKQSSGGANSFCSYSVR